MVEMGGVILVWEKTQMDTWRLLGAGRGRETAHRVTKGCKLRCCSNTELQLYSEGFGLMGQWLCLFVL